MDGEGFEPTLETQYTSAILKRGGAKSGALEEIDPELEEVVKGWLRLPTAVRAGIMAMVRTAKK